MSERTPYESNPRLRCEEWEALLADALDGALTEANRATFERHTAECPTCVVMLDEAGKGQQWLQFLHPEPAVPADLMSKILARTVGAKPLAVSAGVSVATPYLVKGAAWRRIPVTPTMRRVMEPRLMMTAAMAFFSIALTLNMAGVRLTALRTQDLRPSVLRSNLERQFYTAKAPVVRYYENLRVVYEVESRMRELRRSSESEEPKATPPAKQQKPAATNDKGGTVRKNGGKSESPRTADSPIILVGRPMLACLQVLPGARRWASTHDVLTETEIDRLFYQRADQAGRSLA